MLIRMVRGRGEVAIFTFCFSLAALLSWFAGAFQAEFGGYPDEPAHYVTGLMIHDYIAGWFPATPLRFAENYYLHYPKVAFGHWPPVFHFLQAIWMLLFGEIPRLPARTHGAVDIGRGVCFVSVNQEFLRNLLWFGSRRSLFVLNARSTANHNGNDGTGPGSVWPIGYTELCFIIWSVTVGPPPFGSHCGPA